MRCEHIPFYASVAGFYLGDKGDFPLSVFLPPSIGNNVNINYNTYYILILKQIQIAGHTISLLQLSIICKQNKLSHTPQRTFELYIISVHIKPTLMGLGRCCTLYSEYILLVG